jgi:hypothetical protein
VRERGQIDIVRSATCVDTDDKRMAIRRTADIGAQATTGLMPVAYDYSSICSAIFRASSTSIPRYRTVLSSFVLLVLR